MIIFHNLKTRFWKLEKSHDYYGFWKTYYDYFSKNHDFFMIWFQIIFQVNKMAISAYILKTVEKDPFSRLQMRAKEMFNHHQFFSTNKQYLKIKLMRNETNRWSILLVKTKYW